MTKITWGRNKEVITEFDNFKRLIILSVIIILATTVSSYFDKPRYIETAVMTNSNVEDDALAEPFGYFMGEWNLWEFIGDSVALFFK